jgi:hypothetical protein
MYQSSAGSRARASVAAMVSQRSRGAASLAGARPQSGRVSSSNQFSSWEWFDMVTGISSGPRAASATAGRTRAAAASCQPVKVGSSGPKARRGVVTALALSVAVGRRRPLVADGGGGSVSR